MIQGIGQYVKQENTCLVVWDVQEALVDRIFNREEFVNNLRSFIAWARNKRIPIFYTKITPLPEKFESPLRKMSYSGRWQPGDIIREVYPAENDIVLNKNTASIFTGTNFELMLHNANISNILFTGIATEIGVETSSRHAITLGFIPIVIEELVSSGDRDAHERSLKNMAKMLPVISMKDAMKLF